MASLADACLTGLCSISQQLYPSVPLRGVSYEDVAVALVKAIQTSTDDPGTWSRSGEQHYGGRRVCKRMKSYRSLCVVVAMNSHQVKCRASPQLHETACHRITVTVKIISIFYFMLVFYVNGVRLCTRLGDCSWQPPHKGSGMIYKPRCNHYDAPSHTLCLSTAPQPHPFTSVVIHVQPQQPVSHCTCKTPFRSKSMLRVHCRS
jgi:hypothetical protein